MRSARALARGAAVVVALALGGQAHGGVTVAEGNGELKLGAKFYIDASQTKTDTTVGGATATSKLTGVGLGRAYFSASYRFDEVWSLGLTTDTAIANPAIGGKRSIVYIKKAYLRGAFSPELAFEMGVIGTPWIGYEEGLMKHRYATKTFVDTYKLDSSADAGVGIKGKLGAIGSYHLTVVNGGGYGDISKRNSTTTNARVGFADLGATLDVQYRVGGKNPKNTLTQAMLTYGEGEAWRVGANYVGAKSTPAAGPATKSTGYAGWLWMRTPDGYGAWGRFESLKQTRNGAAASPKTTRYVLGLEWFPRDGVAFSLVYDAAKTTALNFVQGDAKKTTTFGLFSEVKF